MNKYSNVLAQLNDHLLHAANTYDFELLAFDEHGQCGFTLGESATVLMYIDDEGTSLTFATFIWDTLHQLTLAHAKQLLEWNYSGDFVAGMVIGICDTFDKITLTHSIETAAINEENFYSLLVNFSETAIEAQKNIMELFQADGCNTVATPTPSTNNAGTGKISV